MFFFCCGGGGGGGEYNIYPTLRRVGLGLVRMQERSLHYGLKAHLFGIVQTVHRGEAAVVIVLLNHLQHGASVNYYYSDNYHFVDSYNKGYVHCRKLLNSDIDIVKFTF